MLVKQEQLNPCEVELHIEVEVEKVSAAIDTAYLEIGKNVAIQGFRKGKAPMAILKQRVDQDRAKDEAADLLLQTGYMEALEESKLEPFARADVDIVSFEIGQPMTFRAKVPLAPTVELGKYKQLAIERQVVKISDEDVDEELLKLRRRHASYPEITERPAQTGDVVRVEARPDNEPEDQPKSGVAKIGENLPELDEALVGMNAGDVKVVDITYPDDYEAEEVRGKTVAMRIELMEIHEERLPDLTDEWVKEELPAPGLGARDADVVDTVDKLREAVRRVMEQASIDAARADVENQILHQVVVGSEVCFPQVLVDQEVDKDVEELLENLKKRKLTMEDYLKYREVSPEQLRGEFEERARRDLKTRLVLREIVDKEQIKVEEENIEAELAQMAEANHVPVETIRAYVERTNGISSVRNRILMQKVMDFLVESSNIKDVG